MGGTRASVLSKKNLQQNEFHIQAESAGLRGTKHSFKPSKVPMLKPASVPLVLCGTVKAALPSPRLAWGVTQPVVDRALSHFQHNSAERPVH